MSLWTSAALAGAATGGRSFTGLAALALAAPADAPRQPDRTLDKPWARAVLVAAAVGELVADKLPRTPSRLAPPVLVGRLVNAAVCGLVLARRDVPASRTDVPQVFPQERDADTSDTSPTSSVTTKPVRMAPMAGAAAVSMAAAAAASFLGVHWRALAARRFRTDAVGAGLEDALTVALAAAAARR
ncbi:hypothetical protein [Nakamurella endophytica]|uniref:DUF4126 domain-containing protein n=1 Tax=Nakamurella endophytica TaxID=1748367 RepID=A0A917SWD5_9ACTN|nr:hypothetical protein [Nakamurella endophytica]GGM01088.1 hypothetical protein GCM10011594_21460 [Nakamurella endophytica]